MEKEVQAMPDESLLWSLQVEHPSAELNPNPEPAAEVRAELV